MITEFSKCHNAGLRSNESIFERVESIFWKLPEDVLRLPAEGFWKPLCEHVYTLWICPKQAVNINCVLITKSSINTKYDIHGLIVFCNL